MRVLADVQLPPPQTWQGFEDLCWDVWKTIWRDPETHKHGRSGQIQHGVDIYGRPNRGRGWAGVQCKDKENYPERHLSKNEVKAEVEKAKHFEPKISAFTIATTAPRDAEIQKLSRLITESHQANGLFSVDVFGWQDIEDYLADLPLIQQRHYPGYFREGQPAILAQQFIRALEEGSPSELLRVPINHEISQNIRFLIKRRHIVSILDLTQDRTIIVERPHLLQLLYVSYPQHPPVDVTTTIRAAIRSYTDYHVLHHAALALNCWSEKAKDASYFEEYMKLLYENDDAYQRDTLEYIRYYGTIDDAIDNTHRKLTVDLRKPIYNRNWRIHAHVLGNIGSRDDVRFLEDLRKQVSCAHHLGINDAIDRICARYGTATLRRGRHSV